MGKLWKGGLLKGRNRGTLKKKIKFIREEYVWFRRHTKHHRIHSILLFLCLFSRITAWIFTRLTCCVRNKPKHTGWGDRMGKVGCASNTHQRNNNFGKRQTLLHFSSRNTPFPHKYENSVPLAVMSLPRSTLKGQWLRQWQHNPRTPSPTPPVTTYIANKFTIRWR